MERAQTIDIYLLLFAGTLVLLLLAVSVVLFIYIYRKRLVKQQISMKEMNNKLQQDILNSNIEALETERKRFAADLHDEVGSKLSALRLNLVQIKSSEQGSERIETLIAGSKEIIDGIITTVRRISHNLMPPGLEMFGLDNAVEELCTWINTSSMLHVTLDYQMQENPPDQKKQLALYRIIQELMSNTIRHAHAKTISLKIIPSNNEWQLVYKDDGVGLKTAQRTGKTTGLGFRNIEDRVNVLHGKVVYPATEKGFECHILFSLN